MLPRVCSIIGQMTSKCAKNRKEVREARLESLFVLYYEKSVNVVSVNVIYASVLQGPPINYT